MTEIAAGVGISSDVLQQAEQEWLLKKQTEKRDAMQRSRRRLGFRYHVIPYIAISTFLVLLNLVTTPRCVWSVYPILGWGLGVTLHGSCVYRSDKQPQKLFAV